MTLFEAIALAIVEGITEFLPISSTGHMIIVSSLFGIQSSELVKIFTVNIQFGAILSVLVLYWKRFFSFSTVSSTDSSINRYIQYFDFYIKLFVAFLPAMVIGFLLNDFIDSLLENVVVVAIMLIAGGIVLLFVDKWFNNNADENKVTSYQSALKVGFFQCIAMIPGVSRSAATIIGGMTQGWSRRQAAEFSFFLAVPTMFAASAYKLLKSYKSIQSDDIQILLLGNAVAFIVAMLAIKFFIGFLTKNGFKFFGYYRILVGGIILILFAMGIDLEIQ